MSVRRASLAVVGSLAPCARRARCGDPAAPARPAATRTIVSPPPGVSSGVRVPPMASVSPRDSASPRPDAGGVVGVAEPLERREHPVQVGRRDAGPAVDDPQLDPVAEAAAGDAAAAGPAGCSAARCRRRLATTRSSRPGSASTVRQVVGHVDDDAAPGGAEVVQGQRARPRRGRPAG